MYSKTIAIKPYPALNYEVFRLADRFKSIGSIPKVRASSQPPYPGRKKGDNASYAMGYAINPLIFNSLVSPNRGIEPVIEGRIKHYSALLFRIASLRPRIVAASKAGSKFLREMGWEVQ